MRADDGEQPSTPGAPYPPISLPNNEERNRAIGQEFNQALYLQQAPSLSNCSSTTSADKVPQIVEADTSSSRDSTSDESTVGTGPFEVQNMAIYEALEEMAMKRENEESNNNNEINGIHTDETYDIESSINEQEDESEASGNGTYKDDQFELALVPDGELENQVNDNTASSQLEGAENSVPDLPQLEGNLEQTARNGVISDKLADDKQLPQEECNANSEVKGDGQVSVPIEKEPTAKDAQELSKEAVSEAQVNSVKNVSKPQEAKDEPKESWLQFQSVVEQQMREIEQQLQLLEQNEAEEEQLQHRQMMKQNRSQPQPVDPESSADFGAHGKSTDCFDSCNRLGSFLSSMMPAREQSASTQAVELKENHDLELGEGRLFNANSTIDNDTTTTMGPLPLSRQNVPKKHVTFHINPTTTSSGSSCSNDEHLSDIESSSNVSSAKTPADEEERSSQVSVPSGEDGEPPGFFDRMFESIETNEERHLQWLNEVLSATSSRSTESSLTNDPAIESKSKSAAKGEFRFKKKLATLRERKPAVEQPQRNTKSTRNSRQRRSTYIILVAIACMAAVLVVSALAFKNQQDKAKASSQKSSELAVVESDGASGESRTFPELIPSDDPSDSPTD